MSDVYSVTMWGLSKEQRDLLLIISQAWDSKFMDAVNYSEDYKPSEVEA